MAPTTRSKKKTPIGSFPDPTRPINTSRKQRPVVIPLPDHDDYGLRPLEIRNPDPVDPVPPTYTIDLSRPPAERYSEVVADFRPQLTQLTGLFADVVAAAGLPLAATTRFARVFLRRGVHSREQTEELRGISRASGVPLYLLVCFNSLLDLFMGCTSGGARVKLAPEDDDDGDGDGAPRMYHFRTLDWAMDGLRRVVVQLEFVDKPHGTVVARSVTYAGYVGVLTGVRRGLSVSLNFRPTHNLEGKAANFRFYSNLLLILLGLRPSISSRLRDLVVPRRPRGRMGDHSKKGGAAALWNLRDIREKFPALPTTAAYLVFCDGDDTTVLEKDRVTAAVRSSSSFIAITNCDVEETRGGSESSSDNTAANTKSKPKAHLHLIQDLLDEAEDRRVCLEARWDQAQERWSQKKRRRLGAGGDADDEFSASPEDVVKWVQQHPTTNETTHYAVVMDPKAGEVVWVRRWLEGEVVQSRLDGWDRGWTP